MESSTETSTTHERQSVSRWLAACAMDVISRLKITSDPMISDRSLVRKIRSSLLWNRKTHSVRDAVKVDVSHGVAYLRGYVDTRDERDEAGRVAMTTLGIWRVENHLQVGRALPPEAPGTTTLPPEAPGTTAAKRTAKPISQRGYFSR